MSIEALFEKLKLIPYPEGGYFKETVRISQNVCRIEKDGRFWDESSPT